MKGKIYVAGPMQGKRDFNFPAFDAAARELRADGWEVFSPAERDRDLYGEDTFYGTGSLRDTITHGFDLRAALAADMEWIALNADAIYMLHGWETSSGAQAEWALARAISIKIYYQD